MEIKGERQEERREESKTGGKKDGKKESTAMPSWGAAISDPYSQQQDS